MFKTLLLAGAALAIAASASAKDLKAVGVTVGSLGNPYFVAVGKGVTDAVHEINPNAKVTIA
jgi:ribose transport system substrate-binding protein